METTIRKGVIALIVAAAATALSSCYYDPSYYSGSASVPATYSSGYGHGYGYGGSNFSTSVFISTGDPRWGYDPYCYSYYDYHRRCYYDPYLHGYYPVGYRPPVVVGVPHPYGYRRGYCPPPRTIRNVTVVNYRDRVGAYRRTNYQWARNVNQARPQNSGGRVDQFGRGDRGRTNVRQDVRPTYREDSRPPTRQGAGVNRRPTTRTEAVRGRTDTRTATRTNRQPGRASATQGGGKPARQETRQEINRPNRRGEDRPAPQREEQQRGNSGSRQEIRHLGQG